MQARNDAGGGRPSASASWAVLRQAPIWRQRRAVTSPTPDMHSRSMGRAAIGPRSQSTTGGVVESLATRGGLSWFAPGTEQSASWDTEFIGPARVRAGPLLL